MEFKLALSAFSSLFIAMVLACLACAHNYVSFSLGFLSFVYFAIAIHKYQQLSKLQE